LANASLFRATCKEFELFERRGGKLRVTTAKPVEIIEGNWDHTGVVVIKFPDKAHARAWKDDPDYRALANIKHQSARTNMIVVKGI